MSLNSLVTKIVAGLFLCLIVSASSAGEESKGDLNVVTGLGNSPAIGLFDVAEGDDTNSKDAVGAVPARAAISCALPSKFSYNASISDEKLLELKLSECKVVISNAGAVSIVINMEIDINEEFDAKNCQAFTTGLMFEIRAKQSDFYIPNTKAVALNEVLHNVDGDSKSLDYFGLHTNNNDVSSKLSDVFFGAKKSVSFSDIYFGNIILVDESSTGDISTELRKKLPVLADLSKDHDYKLDLETTLFLPRGICFGVEPGGNIVNTPIEFN